MTTSKVKKKKQGNKSTLGPVFQPQGEKAIYGKTKNKQSGN